MNTTPGPWQAKGPRIDGADETAVAFVTDIASCIHPDTVKANARLIAAAPMLLEACRTILKALDDSYPTDGYTNNVAYAIDFMHAAISKATGQ